MISPVMSRRKSKNVKSMVKKQIEKYVEKKTVIYSYFGGVTDSLRTPLDNHVTATAQGLDQNERIGNRLNVTSLKYDLFFTGADTTNSMRCIFYIPKNPAFLMSAGSAVGFNKAPDEDQFNILRDIMVTTSSGGPNCVRKQGWIRFNRGTRSGHKERYSGALNTDLVDGHIYVYMVSDSLAVSDPQVNGYIRSYYTDA